MKAIHILACLMLALPACANGEPTAPRTIAAPFDTSSKEIALAPLGSAVSSDVHNYNRVAPYVATAGVLRNDAVAEVQSHGFRLIIDLRQPEEDGVAEEEAAADALGITRVHLPFASDDTAWAQVEAIEALLSDNANYPVLIHCGSANRAAAVWALLRTRMGVDATTAIEEARAAGLTSREAFVRELLGLAD